MHRGHRGYNRGNRAYQRISCRVVVGLVHSDEWSSDSPVATPRSRLYSASRALYGTLGGQYRAGGGYNVLSMWLPSALRWTPNAPRINSDNYGELQRVYIQPLGRWSEVFVLASLHQLNAAVPSTIKKTNSASYEREDYSGKEMPIANHELTLDRPNI